MAGIKILRELRADTGSLDLEDDGAVSRQQTKIPVLELL